MRTAMMRRVVMGVVLAVVGLGSVLDIRIFTAIVVLIGCGSLFELRAIARRCGAAIFSLPAVIGMSAYMICGMCGVLAQYEGTIIGATMIASCLTALLTDRHGILLRTAATMFATIYIGKLLSYFIVLRSIPETGYGLTVMAIFIVAFTDIFAMLIGKQFGRTTLTEISPAKTVEGALGALCVATLTGAVFADLFPVVHLAWWQGLILGCVTSIAAQFGDVFESGLKREADVKDAGSMLLGHGGVLDRFDSYLFGGIAFYSLRALLIAL